MSSKVTNIATGREIDTTNLTEIAPGVFVGDIEQKEIPRYGLVKIVKGVDGQYRDVLKTWSGYERINKNLPERLGIKMSVRTLRALVYSGLVKGARPTPQMTEIDLEDFARHRAASSRPGFWTQARKDAYTLGYNEVQCAQDDE